ncbi:PIG-L deacetylase family protein [Arthrobacter sp. RT-1]|uniref:PIG-L deacetylase family protein n=1 Tax=Arthrobacter sp. RT-1 TaxID=2292263 RepID=UPI0015F1393F|nr:PIG-L family deacetylase [Arthrobacter sp. RT-1]
MEDAFASPPLIVVLSPHPDDAVFSAWDVLRRGRQVVVITVFAGIPAPGFVTPLDKMHGASESAAWAARRRQEDEAAISSAGCGLVHADLLDLGYRLHAVPKLRAVAGSEPDGLLAVGRRETAIRIGLDVIDAAIGARIERDMLVYVPAGIGAHPDHQDVARYGVDLARRGQRVRLYADSPYYLRHGLPSWFAPRPNPEADEAVKAALDNLGVDEQQLSRNAVRLSEEAITAKMAAMRAYLTEFEAIDADFGGIASDADHMRYETYWAVS